MPFALPPPAILEIAADVLVQQQPNRDCPRNPTVQFTQTKPQGVVYITSCGDIHLEKRRDHAVVTLTAKNAQFVSTLNGQTMEGLSYVEPYGSSAPKTPVIGTLVNLSDPREHQIPVVYNPQNDLSELTFYYSNDNDCGKNQSCKQSLYGLYLQPTSGSMIVVDPIISNGGHKDYLRIIADPITILAAALVLLIGFATGFFSRGWLRKMFG